MQAERCLEAAVLKQACGWLDSELDFDIDPTGEVKLHQGINGFRRRAVDIDDAPMGASFKMFTGILVHMGRTQHAIDLAFGRQGNGSDRSGGGVISRFDDFFAGQIEHAPVKGLEADADLLLGNGSGHGWWR